MKSINGKFLSQIKVKDVLLWAMIAVSLVLMIHNTVARGRSHSAPQELRAEIAEGTSIAGYRLLRPGGEEFVIPSKGTYLISFLSTGCGACQSQVRSLNEMAGVGRYDGVVAVFFELPAKVEEFVGAFKPDFVCVFDPKGSLNSKLKLTTFPQTVELRDGTVSRVWIGIQERFD